MQKKLKKKKTQLSSVVKSDSEEWEFALRDVGGVNTSNMALERKKGFGPIQSGRGRYGKLYPLYEP